MFELDLCYAPPCYVCACTRVGLDGVCDVLDGLGGLFGGVSGCLGDRWRRGVLCSSFELCFFVEGVGVGCMCIYACSSVHARCSLSLSLSTMLGTPSLTVRAVVIVVAVIAVADDEHAMAHISYFVPLYVEPYTDTCLFLFFHL